MSDNPNPRGWREGHWFVDLENVEVAIGPVVWMRGRLSPIELNLSPEQWDLLLAALEIYRSNR